MVRIHSSPKIKVIIVINIERLLSCPICNSSWDAGDIPENVREYYSPPYKYSRLIGIENPEIYDGVSFLKCPDCSSIWDRFSGEVLLNGVANKRQINKAVENLLARILLLPQKNVPGAMVKSVKGLDRLILKQAKSEDFSPREEYVKKILS